MGGLCLVAANGLRLMTFDFAAAKKGAVGGAPRGHSGGAVIAPAAPGAAVTAIDFSNLPLPPPLAGVANAAGAKPKREYEAKANDRQPLLSHERGGAASYS